MEKESCEIGIFVALQVVLVPNRKLSYVALEEIGYLSLLVTGFSFYRTIVYYDTSFIRSIL
jgi:hypothetical protein